MNRSRWCTIRALPARISTAVTYSSFAIPVGTKQRSRFHGRPDDVVVGGRQHQVRRAELPAFGELLFGRGVLRIAGGSTVVGPVGDQGEFLVRQPALVTHGHARRRLPRRHHLLLRVLLDVRGPVDRLLVLHQREGARLARTMTCLAVVLQDRQHVAVIGRLRCGRDRLGVAIDHADHLLSSPAPRPAGPTGFRRAPARGPASSPHAP